VEVLGFLDTPDGVREIEVHAARSDGRHDVRTIQIRGKEDESVPGLFEFAYSIGDRETDSVRVILRTHENHPGFFETIHHSGGEELLVRGKWVEDRIGVSMRLSANGGIRWHYYEVDPNRLEDPAYVDSIRKSLDAFYPSGPLRNNPDHELLEAVVTSEDWIHYLEPAGSSNPDDETERTIQRVCVGAAVVSKLSCLVASLNPFGWIVCVPSTGISLACLAYQIQRTFSDDEGSSCPCDCLCQPGGGGS
jgi:hypothetical protein